jgi:hypothetical protein
MQLAIGNRLSIPGKRIRIPGGEAERQPSVKEMPDYLACPIRALPWQRVDETPEIAIDCDGAPRFIENALVD